MELIKVKNEPNLFRDSQSKAIITNDKDGLDNYRRLREQKLKEKQELASLKNEVSEIKALLLELLNKSKS